jgi:uncharacterized Rmd1/YagE family protein
MEARSHQLRSFVFSHSLNMVDIANSFSASDSSIDPRACLSTKVGPDAYIFIFNYGSAVFWNVPPDEEATHLNRILGLDAVPNLQPRFSDTFIVQEQSGPARVEFNRLLIEHLNQDRMEVIASTLAQSTSMEYYESLVEESWRQVDTLVTQLREKGTFSMHPAPINRKIAESLSLRSTVVRVLHLLDKPDLIWEDKVMDEIYGDLRAMFDLPERFQALEYKIGLIQQTLSVVVETIRDRRLYWLELAIVLLIVFEIVMSFIR